MSCTPSTPANVLTPSPTGFTADFTSPPPSVSLIELFGRNPFQSSPAAVLFFDVVLTFDDEVEQIWSKRFSKVSVLFFLVSNPFLSLLLC